MYKHIQKIIILSVVLITLTLCFSEDLVKNLQGEYGLRVGAIIHGFITMGTVGILALIYWWINK